MSLECPYCDHFLDDPDDCGETMVTYQSHCPACEKNFTFTVEYSVDYSASTADCLNGGEHRYKEQKIYGSDDPRSRWRCLDCEKTVNSLPVKPQEVEP